MTDNSRRNSQNPAAIRPGRLRPGDNIAVVAPASAPDMPALRRGVRAIEQRGYRVVVGKHVGDRCDHLGGRDVDRLSDLVAAVRNPDVRAIFAARGGAGCIRLLGRVPWPLFRKHPKILVGFSDLTALQLALLKRTGLVTFSGPMVSTDFDGVVPFTARHFWPLLELPGPPRFRFPVKPFVKGNAQGPLIAGTLSLIQSLLGTPFSPSFDGAILVLEDIHEKAHRVDRALAQLVLAGVWERLAGVVFASWTDCAPRAALMKTLRHYASKLDGPSAFGLPYGHVDRKITLPQGVPARLDGSSLRLLEGGVV